MNENPAKVIRRDAPKDPFIRISKRTDIVGYRAFIIRAIAIIASLIVIGAFVYLVTKVSPLKIYKYMYTGTFGNSLRIFKTLQNITPLLGLGIALAPAFKMRFWNIGAEGQMLMGGLAATFCAINFSETLSPWLLILFMFLAAVITGAIWGFIPAFFKANWGTNETLFTLMLNYIALNIVLLMTNIWKGQNTEFGQISEKGWLPKIFGEQSTICVIIVIVLTVLMYFYLKRSKQGYEIAVVGESENTAKYAGISIKKVIIRTMLISGAICGICGFFTVSGIDHTISSSTAGGRGFTAIIVAWLAKFNTFYMLLTSFLLIFLDNAATEISSMCNLNDSLTDILTGIILFFILGSEFFINYKILFRKKNETEVQR